MTCSLASSKIRTIYPSAFGCFASVGKLLSIRAAADDSNVELWIVSEINSWTAQDFVYMAQYYGNEKPYVLNIYSPGGDPFAAFAIHDFIAANGIKATARVWGHAASAAAIIACSCERVEMGENSFLMVHKAYGGDDQELLDSINEKQVALFKAKSGMSASAVSKLMEAETWMDAKEAKANGICDAIIKELKVAAIYKAQYMETNDKPTPEVKPEEVKPVVEETPKVEPEATEEVEEEVKVTPAEAIQAGFKGSFKFKTKVSAEMKQAVASLTTEVKDVKAQLQERIDEVTGLKEKLQKAEDAKVKAEGEATAIKASSTALTEELAKIKASPLAPKAEATTEKDVQIPGGGPTSNLREKGRPEKLKRIEEETRAAYARFEKPTND